VVVIVAGRLRRADPLQPNITAVAEAAYALFQSRGYTHDDIFLLAPGSDVAHFDASATVENLRQAIVNWAPVHLTPGAPFTLYMVDHGSPDLFYLDEPFGQQVAPHQLDTWLSALERAVAGVQIRLILEACYAGSLIEGTNTASRGNRVIVAASSADQLAKASGRGAHFSDQFISALKEGKSLYASWYRATDRLEELYSGPAQQTPWLDANGNGIPNEAQDLAAAAAISFGNAGTLCSAATPVPSGAVQALDCDEAWSPYVQRVAVSAIDGSGHATIRATVLDDKGIDLVWAAIYPPGYTPPLTGPDLAAENAVSILLQPQGNNEYAGSYPDFETPGTYRVAVFAEDGEGLVSDPEIVLVAAGGFLYLPSLRR
jgi:hypothetical protein